MIEFAPIVLFTYKRLDTLQQTVCALAANYLAAQSDLIIYSDGAKDSADQIIIEEIRGYLKTIKGFNTVTIFESQTNQGLAVSIIKGVSQVLEDYETVIVLEDDLITSANFLDFMNQALMFYKNESNIFSVSGWSLNIKALNDIDTDYYYHYRMSSWGWGIWKNRWDKIIWDDSQYIEFKYDFIKQLKFNRGGWDMSGMLIDYINRKNNSWAIRACYHQFENDLLTIAPKRTKVNNIGFGQGATHTKNKNRFDQPIDIDLNREFIFNEKIVLNSKILSESKNYFSFFKRIKSKFNI